MVDVNNDTFGLDHDRDGVGCENGADPAPPPDSGAGSDDPRFGTCREAVAAGYGPFYEGQDPEYHWYRDADSDGIVCEG